MALRGGNSTQVLRVKEVVIGGQAPASAVNIMKFARDMVLGTTPTGLAAPNSDGPKHPHQSVLSAPPIAFTAAATGPSRSNDPAVAKLDMSFNAWGGLAKAYDLDWWIVGNAVNSGESSLSAFTGGNVGPIGADIIYEPM